MLLVYGKSLGNTFVRWDDGLLIYENPAVMEMTPASLLRVFTTYDPELYIPLTLLTYQIDYQIAGPNPFIFHLGNWFWHLGSALLVAWLAFLLLGRRWIAIVVGLLFMLHPLHTEAVAWASGRKDVLSLFFFLASIIGYLYFRDDGSKKAYRLSILCFLLGLMAKGQILILPVVLVLLDVFRGRVWSKAMLTDKIPYVLLSVIFGIIGIIGKLRVAGATDFGTKIVMSFKSAVFYLQKLFWPDHFSLLYPYTGDVTIASPDFYVPLAILIAIAAACLLLRKKLPELWFGFLFYYFVLSPTFLNFAKGDDMGVYSASDRYAYVASVGIFLMVGFLLARLLWKDGSKEWLVASAVTMVIVVPLGVRAHEQSMVWRDTETLFANVIKHFPESSHIAYNNLGNMYRLRGDLEGAIERYKQGLAIHQNPKTWSNLGGAYRQLKRYAEAEDAYTHAFAIAPGSKEAHFGLGILYAELGRRDDAKAEYAKALAIDPDYEEAHTNLGSVLLADRDIEGAIAHYQRALEINNYFADAQYNLAFAYSTKGDDAAALAAYERSMQLSPRSLAPRINAGILYAKKGERAKSIEMFESVLTLDPGNATAKEALRQLGR